MQLIKILSIRIRFLEIIKLIWRQRLIINESILKAKNYLFFKELLFSLLLFFCSLPSLSQNNEVDQNVLSIQSAHLVPTAGPSDKPRKLKIDLLIKPGFKAYVDKFKLTILEPYPTKQSPLTPHPVHQFFDKYSKSNKYGVTENATLTSTVEVNQPLENGSHRLIFELNFQACSESVCYFPQTIKKEIEFLVDNPQSSSNLNNSPTNLLEENFLNAQKRGMAYLFVFVFLAGVLTSLTPCLLPMLPLTIAVIGKGHSHDDKLKKFINALTYVFGIATTYSLLGILAASSGALFGNILSNTWTQICFGAAFIFMGFAQFGLFEFQTPLGLQNYFHKLSRATGGIFLSGLLSGLIASPCVGPVLVGILTFIANTQNLLLGFGLMFTYALGLGQLLIVLGVSSSLLYKFPRSPWIMKLSKTILGFALIASGLFYLSLVWPKINGNSKNSSNTQTTSPGANSHQLLWSDYSDKTLEEAKKLGKPIIIDFFADWCLACHELDEKTFSQAEIQELLKDFVLIRFDATNDSPLLGELRSRYQIVGLPTVLFFDHTGKWKKELTLNEFESVEKFKVRLQKIKSTPPL